ncbi:MAG: TonB-dependent receptor [Sphingorhabdus sp.]
MLRTMLKSGTAVAVMITAFPSFAQDAGDDAAEQGGIEEIVVTAQRRNENVQDVPIAISAFSSEQLEAQGVSNALQLGQFIPNMTAQNNTGIGSANAYFLRGLGNTETIATFDPPVGTYVDDIYLSRQNANNLSLFDVERIEVLRGPQGTLFGRNTTGGAVSVVMREPGPDFGGYAEIGYGRYDRKIARASVDIPLAPSFGAKISGYWQNDDGYVKNVTTGQRMNDDDGWGVRLGLSGDLGGARWKAAYAHLEANGENILNFDCNPADSDDCKGRFATTGLQVGNTVSTSTYAPLVIRGEKANYLQGNRSATDLITSNLDIDLSSDITLSLITGYVNVSQKFALDFFDGRGAPSISTPNPVVRGFTRGGFTILNDGQHEQFSQEIKIAGSFGDGFVDFVAGGYYLDERNRTDFADIFSLNALPFPPFTVVPGGFSLLLGDRILRNKTTALAGYAQADFNITEQIKLTAGIRYTDEKKTFSIADNRASCNDGSIEATCLDNSLLVSPSGRAIPRSQTAKLWTPRFAINFKPNEDVLLFASATRGFKSGGWNARATSATLLTPFAPEKVWSYEAGIKSDLFDRRVRANVTFFWMDVKNLQTPSAFLPPVGAPVFITQNFADYRNKGIEAELSFQPVDGLNLYANVGYQDDRYIIPNGAPLIDIYGIPTSAGLQAQCRAALAAGNIAGGPGTASCGQGIVNPQGNISTPVRTPKWSLAIGGSYRAEIGNDLAIVPSVNATYRSDQETGTSNLTIYSGSVTGTNGTFPANLNNGRFIVGSFSEAAWLVNAGLALKGPDNKWSLSVDCTNCFNESFVQSTLANYSYLNRPMEWTVRAKYKF